MYEHVAIVVGDSTPERVEQVLASHPELTMIGTFRAEVGVVDYLNELTSMPSMYWLGIFDMMPSADEIALRAARSQMWGEEGPAPYTIILLPTPDATRDAIIDLARRRGYKLILVDQDPDVAGEFPGLMFDYVGESQFLQESVFLFEKDEDGHYQYLRTFDSPKDLFDHCVERFENWDNLAYIEGTLTSMKKHIS
jgi:hypothetical protein